MGYYVAVVGVYSVYYFLDQVIYSTILWEVLHDYAFTLTFYNSLVTFFHSVTFFHFLKQLILLLTEGTFWPHFEVIMSAIII